MFVDSQSPKLPHDNNEQGIVGSIYLNWGEMQWFWVKDIIQCILIESINVLDPNAS